MVVPVRQETASQQDRLTGISLTMYA